MESLKWTALNEIMQKLLILVVVDFSTQFCCPLNYMYNFHSIERDSSLSQHIYIYEAAFYTCYGDKTLTSHR